MKNTITFTETQKPTQAWIWVVVMACAIFIWFLFIQQVVLDNAIGKPAPDIAIWIIWILIGLFLPVFTFVARLKFKVTDKVLKISWFPIFKREIYFKDIKKAESKTYKPVREFGGWGIRFGRNGSRAYSMSGNLGVELTLKNGKVVMLGTQKPKELSQAINNKL